MEDYIYYEKIIKTKNQLIFIVISYKIMNNKF